MSLDDQVLKMLSSENVQHKTFALETIKNSKLNSPTIIEALVKAAHDQDQNIAENATKILVQLAGSQTFQKNGKEEARGIIETNAPPIISDGNDVVQQDNIIHSSELHPAPSSAQSNTGIPIPINPTELLQEQVKILRNINIDLEKIYISQIQTEKKVSILPEFSAGMLKNRGVPMSVYVSDVDMQFKTMITFMIKWAIASVPAGIILGIIVILLLAIFGGVIKGLTGF